MGARPSVYKIIKEDDVTVEIRVFAPHDTDAKAIQKKLTNAYDRVLLGILTRWGPPRWKT